MESNSPFLIVQNFISPSLCEQAVNAFTLREPDKTPDGKFMPMFFQCPEIESILFERIQVLLPEITHKHQRFQYKGTEPMIFEWYPASSSGKIMCENSEHLRQKWVKVRERDMTAVLFFSDYNSKTPFDSEYEVYGGKLEFPQHNFGFNPQRGTLVVFPSVPHFINVTTPILFGDLFQVKIQMASQVPYFYDPKLYPGDYKSWLKEYA